jgi:hypothetical protein
MPVDLDAAERVINRPHIIDLREDGWTIMHPPSCHPDLFACLVNRAAGQDLAEPPPEAPGRYFCDLDGDGFLAIGEPAGDSQGIDWAALVAELRELRGRYGTDGEVWCGARRDQAGSAYCVEMAGHEQHGIGHMWHEHIAREIEGRTG